MLKTIAILAAVAVLAAACDDYRGAADAGYPDGGDVDTDSDTDTGCEPCEGQDGEQGCVDEFGCCDLVLDALLEQGCEQTFFSACTCHPDDPCGFTEDGLCQVPCDEVTGEDFDGPHWDPDC